MLRRFRSVLLSAIAVGFGVFVYGRQDHTNLDESKVPRYTLPALLVMQDGTPVRTAGDWTTRRRPEILKLCNWLR
jgi:hypothetical protein